MSYIEDVTASPDWAAIAGAAHHDPHSVLGTHPDTDALGRTTTTIRARRPLAESVEAVFDDGAHHPRGAFGPQRHRTVTAVCERVHLLGDHVRRLANTTREQRRVLEYREFYVAIAGPTGLGEQAVPHRDELSRRRRQVIGNALRRLKITHSQTFEEWVVAAFLADGGRWTVSGQNPGAVVEHQ